MRITIPMEPVAKPRPRSSNAGGYARMYTPKGGKVGTFIASVRLAASEAYSGPPLDGPLRVDCEFVFNRPKRMIWKRRPMPRERHTIKPDRDNLDKQILDSLNGIVWRDDAQVCEGMISKWIAAGDEQAHCVVTVTELDSEKQGTENLGASHGYSRFTGDDAEEDGERLTASIIVALENEAQRLRKKIIKIEQLGFAAPRTDLVAARRRLEEIDRMLSE